MSEVTLDDVFKELADEEEAKIIAKEEELAETLIQPPQEIAPIDKDLLFTDTVKYLNRIGHEIEDIASVATRMIAERRNHYNHVFETNKHFLKEYAIDHLKRDKDGQIKGKSYKTLEAGGGIFFRQKAQQIHINEEHLPTIKKLLLDFVDNDKTVNDLIKEKITFEITDKQFLVDLLQEVIVKRAQEILQAAQDSMEFPEDATPEQKKKALDILIAEGENEIFNGNIVEIEPLDPFAYMYVGSAKANTFRSIKSNITQAIDGRFRADEEDVDLLIEELE